MGRFYEKSVRKPWKYILFILLIAFLALCVYRSSIGTETFTASPVIRPIVFFDADDLLRTNLSPGLRWCVSNPFLVHFDPKVLKHLEIKWNLWKDNELRRTYETLHAYASSSKGAENIVQLAYPTTHPLVCPKHMLKRYGASSRDSGKLLCALQYLPMDINCTIYSLGSRNEFEFEEDISRQTRCNTHIFDCTSSPPSQPIPRAHFYEICLGEISPLQQYMYPYSRQNTTTESFFTLKNFMSFKRTLLKNEHTAIHILKMDIEGGEYSVFTNLFTQKNIKILPYQISFESHWWNRDIYHAMLHLGIFSEFWRTGYRFMSHEVNGNDPSCVEWTLMRVFC